MEGSCPASRGKSLLVRTVMSSCLQTLLLLLQSVVGQVTEGTRMCTKAVPVEGGVKKKVSVLRRVPASCSNWDKAWAWITSKDCGTKYRLDSVEVQSPQVITYRVVKVCCQGDLQCQRAQDGASSSPLLLSWYALIGLALLLSFILISIGCIMFCRCCIAWTPKSWRNSSADQDTRELNFTTYEENESILQTPNDDDPGQQQEKTTESDMCESAEYAEIHAEADLPRYDDIFDDDQEQVTSDPILQPTAPPMWLYESRDADEGKLTHQKKTTLGDEGTFTNQKKSRHDKVAEGEAREVIGDERDVLLQQLGSKSPPSPPPRQREELAKNTTDDPGLDKRVPEKKRVVYYYYNPAVRSVTPDAPVLLTGVSSPSTPPPKEAGDHLHPRTIKKTEERKSRGCDEVREKDGECSGGGDDSGVPNPRGHRVCWSTSYEALVPRRAKDCHEYQRLSASVSLAEDGDATSVADRKLAGGDRND